MKRIKLFKTYYVSNKDLKLDDFVPGHEVIVVRISKNQKLVKIKTITSLESPSKCGEKRKFKNTKMDLVKELHEGNIIAVPKKYLNTPKLSGIYMKGIWINANKLQPNRYNTKLSPLYFELIRK